MAGRFVADKLLAGLRNWPARSLEYANGLLQKAGPTLETTTTAAQ
jgi:hypothetical protein